MSLKNLFILFLTASLLGAVACSNSGDSLYKANYASAKTLVKLDAIEKSEWSYLFDGYHQALWFSTTGTKARVEKNKLYVDEGTVLISDSNYKDYVLEISTNGSACDLALAFKPINKTLRERQPSSLSAIVRFNPGDDMVFLAGTQLCSSASTALSDGVNTFRITVADGKATLYNQQGEALSRTPLANSLNKEDKLFDTLSATPLGKIALYGRNGLFFSSIRIARFQEHEPLVETLNTKRRAQNSWTDLLSQGPVTNSTANSVDENAYSNKWVPKVLGEAAGSDASGIFEISKNIVNIRFDKKDSFDRRFAHLYLDKKVRPPFSLSADYRFFSYQAKGAPNWAYRNSGLMLFTDSPFDIPQDQDIPKSIEAQLLSADPKRIRTTGNLCTPGTQVEIDERLVTQHCIYSTSTSFTGDDWVNIEVQVDTAGQVSHFINGEKVFSYRRIQNDDGTLLLDGFIALQAESQNMQFKNLLLKQEADDTM